MLPPIQSVSNMTVQHKVPPRQEQGGHPRGGQGQHQGERHPQGTVSVSSMAAAKVNVLNLSGTDGMTTDLSRLAHAVSKALDMPPMRGESAVMHALRLAEAVLALNTGPRMALERQLGHLLQGLSLQLVALAMKHPGGPEAARIAAYLELNRQKGDRATQAVVDSYLQNEVSEADSFAPRQPRPEIELKGRLPFPLESQLAQAAQSAALRAGIALPYLAYAIEEPPVRGEEPLEGRHAFGGEDEGDDADDESPEDADEDMLAADDEDEDDAPAALPAADRAGDDLAYSYYQRLSGDL